MQTHNVVASLNKYFSVFLPEKVFISKTYDLLSSFGFDKNNTLPLICTCRDEICQSIFEHVRVKWMNAFNLSSLAGLFIAGKTALVAALGHAPKVDEKRRYVFYAFSHIGIDNNGELGRCSRVGIENSTACGALIGFYNALKDGNISATIDEDDVEMSLIRKRLVGLLSIGSVSDLLHLTRIARQSTLIALEDALHSLINTSDTDYAIFTGIQINAGDNYIAPDESYLVIDGIRQDITVT